MSDIEYSAGLTVKEVLDSLNKIDRANEKLWKKAEKDANKAIKQIVNEHSRLLTLTGKLDKNLAAEARAYEKLAKEATRAAQAGERASRQVGDSAQVSGVKIGAVAGAVSALITELISLGEQGVRAFADIAAESVKLAASFESNKGLIKNIFEGDEEAANAVIDRLTKRGAEIGLLPETAVKLGVSFLPDTGSLEQLDKFIEGAVKLRKFSPEKTFEDIRFSLEQLISGDVRAFQDRLNLPKETIERGRELQKEFGNVAGALKLMDELFTKFGIDLEDISDTAVGKVGEIQAKLQELQLVGGEKALESIKPFLDEIIAFLTENREALILFASSMGDAAGSAVEFIQELSGLDEITPEKIIQLGQDIFAFVEGTRAAGTLIGQFLSVVGQLLIQLGQLAISLNIIGVDFGKAGESFAGWVDSLFKGEGFFQNFLDFLAQSHAGLVGLTVILGEISESATVMAEAFAALAAGDIAKAIELNAKSQDIFNNSLEEGRKAINAAYAESRGIIDGYTKAVDDQKKSQEELANSFDETNEAGKAQADAFLKQQRAAKDAAAALKEFEEANKKINEETAKAELDLSRKLEDIDIQTARKRFDILQDFADKRLDAARENLQKIADIERKNEQGIQDAKTDLERDEEDIARKQARERIEIERDSAQKRVDVEENFRRKLADIRTAFELDAEEAERSRDAVAFLRALRRRDSEIQQAQQERQRSIDDVRTEGDRRREELRTQQEQELEDARITNERKLEDLRTSLERQLEEQRINFAQEQEEIALNEARKLEELELSRQRDIEDAQRAHQRKLEDLQTSLAAELEIIKNFNALKEAEEERHTAALEELARRQRELLALGIGSARNTPTRPAAGSGQAQGPHPGAIPGFQHGGRPAVGRAALVGERGPELFFPDVPGTIIPSHRVMASAGAPAAGSSVTNFINEFQNQFPLSTQDTISPIQRAIIEQMIINAWAKLQ